MKRFGQLATIWSSVQKYCAQQWSANFIYDAPSQAPFQS